MNLIGRLSTFDFRPVARLEAVCVCVCVCKTVVYYSISDFFSFLSESVYDSLEGHCTDECSPPSGAKHISGYSVLLGFEVNHPA